jgi:hypothetical protein
MKKVNLVLVGLMLMVSASMALGSVSLELFAVDGGAGYTISDGGKTVTLTPGFTGNIVMELRSVFSSPGAAGTYLSVANGNIVTDTVNHAVVSGGSMSFVMNGNYDEAGYSNGTSKTLTPLADLGALDSVADLGTTKGAAALKGTSTATWTNVSPVAADLIHMVPASGGSGITGNQVLGTLTLSATGTNSAALLTDKTQVQWYWLQFGVPASQQSFFEGGAKDTQANTAFGTTYLSGAPVSIVVPEPISILMLTLGGLGLLRRKSC